MEPLTAVTAVTDPVDARVNGRVTVGMMLQGLGDLRLSLYVFVCTLDNFLTSRLEEVELFAVAASNSAPSDQTVVTSVVTVVFRRFSGASRRVISHKC